MINDNLGLIIPAYNAHDTIQKLLHSICMFDFVERTHVLIVDDFSERDYEYLRGQFPDLSLEILRLEENHGPGYARNVGIDWCVEMGFPFVTFADSDDYFIKNDFWDVIEEEDKEKNDLFIFSFYDSGSQCSLKDFDVWCFGKIYRTSILKENNIRFSENYSNEDVVFNFIYLSSVENVWMAETPIYYWFFRLGSLSRTEGYIYDTIIELTDNLVLAFQKHRAKIKEERVIPMIVNRMIRLYYHFNELIFEHPELLDTEPADNEVLKGIQNFYNNCYKEFEEKITLENVMTEFREINAGNDIYSGFVWIDYYNFLKKVK